MDPRINLINRLTIMLKGYVYLEDRMTSDGKSPLPFYLFKCPEHGYVEGYPQGYDEKLLCPQCLEGLRKEKEDQERVDALLLDATNESIRSLTIET